MRRLLKKTDPPRERGVCDAPSSPKNRKTESTGGSVDPGHDPLDPACDSVLFICGRYGLFR
jgi:hypothetical protein